MVGVNLGRVPVSAELPEAALSGKTPGQECCLPGVWLMGVQGSFMCLLN